MSSVMRMSPRGIVQLASEEGLVIAPYYDVVRVLTVGVGHTAPAGPPRPEQFGMAPPKVGTDAYHQRLLELVRLFQADLQAYESRVRRALKVPVPQHVFDALVSFDFNTGGIFQASAVQMLNEGAPLADVADRLALWARPAAIIPRRSRECRLLEHGVYVESPKVAVQTTDGAGKLQGTVERLDGARLLRLLGQVPAGGFDAPQVQPVKADAEAAGTLWTRIVSFLGFNKG